MIIHKEHLATANCEDSSTRCLYMKRVSGAEPRFGTPKNAEVDAELPLCSTPEGATQEVSCMHGVIRLARYFEEEGATLLHTLNLSTSSIAPFSIHLSHSRFIDAGSLACRIARMVPCYFVPQCAGCVLRVYAASCKSCAEWQISRPSGCASLAFAFDEIPHILLSSSVDS